VDPCGYMVYYLWTGVITDVIFDVYTGYEPPAPAVTSLGDCLTMASSAGGNVKKVAKAAKGYKHSNIVTLLAAPLTATY